MKILCSHSAVVDIADLRPHPKNRNKHGDKQISVLARIIDKNGQRSPIVVSKLSGYITKGHCRLLALQALNWAKCAVDYQNYASEADEYRDMIADNEIARYAEFDVGGFLDDVRGVDVNFEDFGLIDFTPPDVLPPAGNTDPDAVPEAKETRARRGDVWQLG